ncbi:MAG: hypothetical protein COC01_03585 [Bacteroidetes bacterium]|nr:SAM-dependent chlorinase/fluorinase [Bacteroidia bacterium]PCH68514.1 MAG: hypothetical protein COC01_03585 [Bacteroidota bacterium]
MSVITLTTDLGLTDFYVSVIKGAIYNELPEAKIVDISHEIEPFNLLQAGFILKNSYHSFPQKSVHIIGVDTEHDINTQPLAISANEHFFVGPDNGIFSLIFDKIPDEIVTMENVGQDTDIVTFPTKDLYVKGACHLLRGGELSVLGNSVKSYRESKLMQPIAQPSLIQGNVLYVDRYGNVITNVTRQLFNDTGKGRKFEVTFGRSDVIDQVFDSYNAVPPGERLCLFSSSGYLEIAINKGNASGLLGFSVGDTIRIEFR